MLFKVPDHRLYNRKEGNTQNKNMFFQRNGRTRMSTNSKPYSIGSDQSQQGPLIGPVNSLLKRIGEVQQCCFQIGTA